MALSDNMRGAGLMMVAMAAYTFNDACMKALSGEIPMFQSVFLRGVLSTMLLLIVARARGGLRFNLPRREWGLIAIRAASEVAATVFFLTALFNMPIASVTAILQVLPLTVALAAAVFLREPLGWRRMLAILVGFIGVLIIVRPGADGFNIYAISAMMAVVFVTIRDLVVRRMSASVPSMTVAISASAAVTISFGLASLTVEWVPLGLAHMGLIFTAALFLLAGYISSVTVMRVGEIGFTAPFRYTGLIWAMILGWLVFAEWPDNLTLIGAGIIVATGVFTLYRERRALKKI